MEALSIRPTFFRIRNYPQKRQAIVSARASQNVGDRIDLTDGKGFFYKAEITQANAKHCLDANRGTGRTEAARDFRLHIAVAPTKNMDRMEWFVERPRRLASMLSPTSTAASPNDARSNRNVSKKIMVSAMKQSQKATLPEMVGMTDFQVVHQKSL